MKYISKFLFITLLLFTVSCSSKSENAEQETVYPELAALLVDSTGINVYDNKGVTPPDGGCTPLRLKGFAISKTFNDINPEHLVHARAKGLDPNDLWGSSQGIVKMESNQYIYIDSLSHSYPYLMPEAAELLNDIGKAFADSLAVRGGGAYRLKVTSMLRTPMTVGKLRRVNRNASSESAHSYGTTFDISYNKFICDDSTGTRRTFEDLKNMLAIVVEDMHRQGRCLVKSERKQACFHITAK